MKVAIMGHGGIGKTTLIEAMIKAVEMKTGEQIEVVNIHSKDSEFLNQMIERDRGISIINELRCNLFTPPMSRAERRKMNRKTKKK